jgi:hypothetical protein
MFCTLPFGLSSAGHVFSKVLRPMAKYWRSQGHRTILYLDDGWKIISFLNLVIFSRGISRGKVFRSQIKPSHGSLLEGSQTLLSLLMKNPTDKYFMFCALPFGLSSAGHVFSTVLRPMVKYWRSQGHRIILYLDDGWGIESNFNICKTFAYRVRQNLESVGRHS